MSSHQTEQFGTWLARQLRRTGISQAQLADRVGLTRAAVSAWINNRAEPREDTKRAIAAVLGTDTAALFNLATDVAAELPIQWHHRLGHADGGREYGNAAAFAFDADLSVLAREATQNSLDERCHNEKPVRVHYTLHELTGEHLDTFLRAIHWDDLQAHYEQAATAEQKVSRSIRAALDNLAENRSLTLLRVDDYNAAGLTGPEYDDGRYAAVVRRQLDSFKHAGGRAGGSYGLGKATLWATSRFGLVLINTTLSEPQEGRTERRVVGRLELPWREVDNTAYAGPAWLGEPETEPDRKGVSRSWWADDQTVADLHLARLGADSGSSFLIVGAHDASGSAETLQQMHDKLVGSLADGFWAAMVGGRSKGPLLEACVTTLRNGRVLIPETRVDPQKHHSALSRALQAYLDKETVAELTSGDQVAQAVVPLFVPPRKGKGRVRGKGIEHQAVLLLTPADDDDETLNRVIFMRGNRMTITEHRPRELPLGASPFQAVLLAGYATEPATEDATEDVDLAEQFLRASEPPEHNRWDRTEELTSSYERGALTRLKEFRTAIDATVRSLVGRRNAEGSSGPAALQELLKLDGPGSSGTRRAQGAPSIHSVDAHLEDGGAWHVRVDLKLPEADDLWRLTPVAKFDVRSGGRPTVDWKLLTASDNCRIENGNIVVDPGMRSAAFIGVTDPKSHPVQSSMARLILDIQKARGGAV